MESKGTTDCCGLSTFLSRLLSPPALPEREPFQQNPPRVTQQLLLSGSVTLLPAPYFPSSRDLTGSDLIGKNMSEYHSVAGEGEGRKSCKGGFYEQGGGDLE